MAEDDGELRRKFDRLEKQIAELRRAVLREETQEEDPGNLKMQLRFLRNFYEAPEGKLTRYDASQAAKRAGYDPRGTAGFYSGRVNCLRAEGDWRILTETGKRWYEQYRHHLD